MDYNCKVILKECYNRKKEADILNTRELICSACKDKQNCQSFNESSRVLQEIALKRQAH